MTATTATSPVNKVAAHWAQKVINRRLRKTGILDTGATSGAAPEEDEDAFIPEDPDVNQVFFWVL